MSMIQAETTLKCRESPGARALVRLFQLARAGLDVASCGPTGCEPFRRSMRLGFPEFDGVTILELVKLAENEFPLELRAPFEDTDSIAGAVWRGSDVFDGADDGLVMLRFDAGTLDLPMHVHERSDRFIVALKGTGFFYVSNETLTVFSGADLRAIPVQAGDAIAFTRGLMHTFSSPMTALVLLSYHAPLIELDDPGQYTLPSFVWTPRMGQSFGRESAHARSAEVR